MGFNIGHIFRDVIDDFDFFERIIGDGASGFLGDDFGIDIELIGIFASLSIGLYASPYSEEQRNNAQPPVLPGTPPTFQLIIPDLPPERMTGFSGIDLHAAAGFHTGTYGDHFQFL